MTLCTYDTAILSQCPDLQTELIVLAGLLGQLDQIKVGTGDHTPTWVELADLWEGALVPPAAMVFWYNTDSGNLEWWFSPTGDSYETIAV